MKKSDFVLFVSMAVFGLFLFVACDDGAGESKVCEVAGEVLCGAVCTDFQKDGDNCGGQGKEV